MNRLYPLNIDSVLTESLLMLPPKEVLHTMIQHMREQLQVGCFLASGAVYAVGTHQGVEWAMWVAAQESELVIKDLLTRSFRVLRSQSDGPLETLSVEGLQHDVILDLDADGTRWEGDERDGVPFGFGTLYNANNDKEYEGFRIGDDSWGYGVEFGEDTRAVQFTGWTLKGAKFGQGVVFDRGGKPTSVYFENDLPTDETKLLASTVDAIALSSEWQLTEFNPPVMWRLQTLTIDLIHLNPKAVFTIRNQPVLTTLIIHFPQRSLSPPRPVIADCPLLQRIEFADHAFPSYPFPTLSNLPSLRTILFGRSCFSSPSVCSFIGLPSLTSLVFGNGAMYGCNEAIFQDLPMLKTITFGHNAFHGESGAHRQQYRREPYGYKNKLTIRNCPSLTTMTMTQTNFRYFGTVTLDRVPYATIKCNPSYSPFCWTYRILSSHADALTKQIRSFCNCKIYRL